MKPAELESHIKQLLGKRAEELSKHDISRLARQFLKAGKAAVFSEVGSPSQAAKSLRVASETAQKSKFRLARETNPGFKDMIRSPAWNRQNKALEEFREELMSYPNVTGLALGFKDVEGKTSQQKCVTVFVSKKLGKGQLEDTKSLIPEMLTTEKGYSIPTDVVEVPPIEPFLQAGTKMKQTGASTFGTLGIFGRDNRTDATVALTAMHVFEDVYEFPEGSTPAPQAQFFWNPESEPLTGALIQGTRNGVDAAKVSINATLEPSRFMEGIGEVNYWRPVDLDADYHTAVRMRGAASQGVRYGRIINPGVYMPGTGISLGILVEMQALKGDSGAALVDEQNMLLGLLCGGNGRQQLFSPISSIFYYLSCNLY